MKVHHIGYAVKSIEKSVEQLTKIGFVPGDVIFDDIRNITICFLNNETTCIELVAPNTGDNPVSGIIKKNGVSPYHICYEVENLESAIKELGKKWVMISQPERAPAINNRNVVFLFNKDVGLIELVEALS